MSNTVGALTPCGHRVLVLPDEIELTSSGGIILVKDEQAERTQMTIGTLAAVGLTAWSEFDDGHKWGKAGDKVLYSKYGGKFITDPSTEIQYVILNDIDILCIIDSAELKT